MRGERLRPIGWLLLVGLALQGAAPAWTQEQRSLTDQAGHVLHLPARVERVGTPGISMASLILALGGRAQLSAITPEVQGNPWLLRLMPEIGRLPTPFVRPAGVHLEQLLAGKPDLVTLWTTHQALGTRLERLGMAVLYLGYDSPEDMIGAARLLGQALGPAQRARAEAFVDYYRNVLQRVSAGLSGLDDAEKPRLYYAGLSPLSTEGQDSMVDAWIERAGGINVAARAGLPADAQVSLEQLLVWQPQFIVVLEESTRRAILADPRWQSLPAVRDGRVLLNPKGINAWCTRAAETALQVLWAARQLHPQRFADVDMAAETRDFYRRFYQYELSDEEVGLILQGADPPPRP
ncbi:periplasmic solute binding protein of iron siderophore transporter [Azotobacter vinelandii CA]|uniref:Periplasmic solute binding protein of iron siderophore transporter n=2 Tax=Azotobacter vinelandii TaxID=354 RepID=C1DN84_AZOVD|nr:ABC transporter substrate-binding protein [Azotobacter vinelandii]ACO79251.1 periplasmic solute binding protein of iron siderophore transporter [Azotobacter vinelandii DJ]AGK14759.1 periplasmic solute binding protein of iron siderophore transporter [Azotobacter vinelandii CA]AGK21061.1 periplasmic solute binding protein of iron siderophore transporter [Azotobacter vinelandii CA6]SFY28030.1 iron complex transport system substrate-binding protein [Azotobacter vinelandii]GLK61875.1 iron ABC tr